MNYDLLDKAIPARRLPDDPGAPRGALFEMLRDLEEMRRRRTALADTLEGDELAALDKQIQLYEHILE
jgi:hypothetical protein